MRLKRYTRKTMRILITMCLVVSLGIITNASSADTSFNSPPANLTQFESELNKSLVGVACPGNVPAGIGFAGNYGLPKDWVDKGLNSLIMTTYSAIQKCGSVVPHFYLNKQFEGNLWFYNGFSPDLATFNSTLNLPKLPTYSLDAPEVGWWVDVAQYIPGFGITWAKSIVRLVNLTTTTLAIDPIIPNITKNALVFNNQGQFIGVVSDTIGKPVPNLMLVQGSPLQCQASKQDSSPTVTLCGAGVYSTNLWNPALSTPTPTPTSSRRPTSSPTPTPTTTNNAWLADAKSAALNAFDVYRVAVDHCSEAAWNSGDFEGSTKWAASCELLNTAANTELGKVSPALKDTSSDSALETLNSVTDSINGFADDVDAITSDLEDASSDFERISESYANFVSARLYAIDSWKALTSILKILPKSLSTKITTSKNWIAGSKAVASEKRNASKVDALTFAASSIANLDELLSFETKLDKMSQQVNLQQYLDKALELFPATVCVSNDLPYFPKSGKCPTKLLMLTRDFINS